MAFASMIYGRIGTVEVERGGRLEPNTLRITCTGVAFSLTLTRDEAAELAREIAVTLEAMGPVTPVASARDGGAA